MYVCALCFVNSEKVAVEIKYQKKIETPVVSIQCASRVCLPSSFYIDASVKLIAELRRALGSFAFPYWLRTYDVPHTEVCALNTEHEEKHESTHIKKKENQAEYFRHGNFQRRSPSFFLSGCRSCLFHELILWLRASLFSSSQLHTECIYQMGARWP